MRFSTLGTEDKSLIRPIASAWNTITFQSPAYSAVMMEFKTPPSYGSTKVTVGIVATDGKILCAGAQDAIEFTATKHDAEVGWDEPESVSMTWKGRPEDGNAFSARLSGSLGGRVERVDVLAQIPKFLKAVIASASGTKPFIYQTIPSLPITVKVDGTEHEEPGTSFMEATFIT